MGLEMNERANIFGGESLMTVRPYGRSGDRRERRLVTAPGLDRQLSIKSFGAGNKRTAEFAESGKEFLLVSDLYQVSEYDPILRFGAGLYL
jgi:hypothetical protein